jgi:pre-mRNA-processing factor 17
MKFHPTQQNSFLVGSSNKKILQFDLTTGTKQFEYSQHLGTVNTITFIEENKFVSSSDDKKLFIW